MNAAMEDLKGLEIDWDEGPDRGGIYGPYNQSERKDKYLTTLLQLANKGLVYPCEKSRKEIQAFGKKAKNNNEYLFSEELRPIQREFQKNQVCLNTNWRFRTKSSQEVIFMDGRKGTKRFKVGEDFADFLVWRKDGMASYELATVVSDHLMGITEIVRGEDLLLSSARQCLLFDCLGWDRAAFYHCELLLGDNGKEVI